MALVLSLDFGTGSVRAGVFDTAGARCLATAEAAYPTATPAPGRAEQDPRDWIAAMVAAVGRALDRAGRREIAAVCLDTTASTVVVCSKAGEVLRPAILWMDCRAADQARATEAVDHPVMAWSGHGDAVEWLVPKAMWLAAHEPGIYARAGVICEAIDFLNHWLTGDWTASRMNATCKWNYDASAGRFHPDLYAAFGVPDLTDRLPARVVPVGAPVGPMTPAAAAALGLPGRPLVVQGGIDAHMGMLGADAVAPGRSLLIGGTSVVYLTHMAGLRDLRGVWGPYPDALVDDSWLVEGGQVSAGSVLSWLSERIFGLDGDGQAALLAQVADIPPEATGLLTLDYWMGNRTPYRDPELRGAVLGLSLWHDRATLYRSAVTSVALGSANVVQDLARQGVQLEHLVLAGGICRNPVWLQATVDAIGAPAEVAREDNLSLYGAAAAAGAALGVFGGLVEAAGAMRAPRSALEPDAARHAGYLDLLQEYRAATDLLTPVLRGLSRSTGAASPGGQP